MWVFRCFCGWSCEWFAATTSSGASLTIQVREESQLNWDANASKLMNTLVEFWLQGGHKHDLSSFGGRWMTKGSTRKARAMARRCHYKSQKLRSMIAWPVGTSGRNECCTMPWLCRVRRKQTCLESLLRMCDKHSLFQPWCCAHVRYMLPQVGNMQRSHHYERSAVWKQLTCSLDRCRMCMWTKSCGALWLHVCTRVGCDAPFLRGWSGWSSRHCCSVLE